MDLNLTFLILPIEVEIATRLAFTPSVEVTSLNLGSLSKLNPSETRLIFPIAPLIAEEDFVEYSSFSQSSLRYVKLSGSLIGENLNVVDPIPNTL